MKTLTWTVLGLFAVAIGAFSANHFGGVARLAGLSTAAVEPDLVTNHNRKANGVMFGGWGPHLKPVFTFGADRYMLLDSDASATQILGLRVFKSSGAGWSQVNALAMNGGVHQPMAMMAVGDVFFAYGVDISANRLIECYVSRLQPQKKACNQVTTSGLPLATPSGANYVGAAVDTSGPVPVRVVWYSVVGANGSGGSFQYLFNGGGGWNGPFTVTLGGYNSLGYVNMAFGTNHRFALAGELYAGLYPNGYYALGYAEGKLGNAAAITTPFKPLAQRSSADLWLDRASGRVHVVARNAVGALRLDYFTKVLGGAWQGNAQAQFSIPGIYRARFVPEADGVTLVASAPDAPAASTYARFTAAELAQPLVLEGHQISEPAALEAKVSGNSAIYVGGPSYQTGFVATGEFAVCGHYPQKDNEIRFLHLDGP